jgi:hypothetical protein
MLNIFKSKEIISGTRTYDFYRDREVSQLQGIPVLENFGKKKDRWYIDLPEWMGPKANLEMVEGADTLLDILSKGKDRITVSFTDVKTDFPDKGVRSTLGLTHVGNGTYNVNPDDTTFSREELPQQIWLCSVTQFIFGDYPKWIEVYVHEHVEEVKPRFNLKKS